MDLNVAWWVDGDCVKEKCITFQCRCRWRGRYKNFDLWKLLGLGGDICLHPYLRFTIKAHKLHLFIVRKERCLVRIKILVIFLHTRSQDSSDIMPVNCIFGTFCTFILILKLCCYKIFQMTQKSQQTNMHSKAYLTVTLFQQLLQWIIVLVNDCIILQIRMAAVTKVECLSLFEKDYTIAIEDSLF